MSFTLIAVAVIFINIENHCVLHKMIGSFKQFVCTERIFA